MSIVDTFIEVKLKDPESFLVVKETLTRIGVASKKSKTLWQSCHLLHKQGRYYIVHFLQLFLLDGKTSTFGDDDKMRTIAIAKLLEDWGLVKILTPVVSETKTSLSQIKILPHSEKKDWTLETKYTIGQKK